MKLIQWTVKHNVVIEIVAHKLSDVFSKPRVAFDGPLKFVIFLELICSKFSSISFIKSNIDWTNYKLIRYETS